MAVAAATKICGAWDLDQLDEMSSQALTAYNVRRCCEALLGEGTERLIRLLAISNEDMAVYREAARALLAVISGGRDSTKQVLGMESVSRLIYESDARRQRTLSDVLDVAQLMISGQERLQQDLWNRVVIPWCQGLIGSKPPLAAPHATIFAVSARLYFDLIGQPELFLPGAEESDSEWRMSAIALMVRRRYFLQFVRRIRASCPDSQIATIIDWASSIVGQKVTLP